MKRLRVNNIIETAKQAFGSVGFILPPFAHWSAAEWKSKGPECDEIRHCMLGWDVTDFGQGRFDEIGRTLLTLRNGSSNYESPKDYAENLILDPEAQRPPLHFHHHKMEDIINQGGGNILVKLFKSTADGECSAEDFTVQVDGETLPLKAGSKLRLEPGQSIAIPPGLIHQFWRAEGAGIKIGSTRYTVSGEVRRVCDDWNDNCFLEPVERFCKIEEDEPAFHYLVHECPPATTG